MVRKKSRCAFHSRVWGYVTFNTCFDFISDELIALRLEEMRLVFEEEELLMLKSELIRKKEAEYSEIAELKEELASMHTLYQYR